MLSCCCSSNLKETTNTPPLSRGEGERRRGVDCFVLWLPHLRTRSQQFCPCHCTLTHQTTTISNAIIILLSYCGFHCFTPPHNIVMRTMFSVTLSQHHNNIFSKWSCLTIFVVLKHWCNNNILYFYQDVWRINLDLVKLYDYDKSILSPLQKLTVLRFNVKMWESPNLLNSEIVKNQTWLKSSCSTVFCFGVLHSWE